MTSQTPLELAYTAYTRPRDPDDRRSEPQVEDALALADTGVFSKRNIRDITGLPWNFTDSLIPKSDHTGGRLNPETLSLMYEIQLELALGGAVDHGKIRTVVNLGTSQTMAAKLLGITQQSISIWMAK